MSYEDNAIELVQKLYIASNQQSFRSPFRYESYIPVSNFLTHLVLHSYM